MTTPDRTSGGTRLDATTLAALLDGTLAPAERERVLLHLARHPEDRELIGEAAALLVDTVQTDDRLTAQQGQVDALTSRIHLPNAPPIQPAPQAGERRRSWWSERWNSRWNSRWHAGGLVAAALVLTFAIRQSGRVTDLGGNAGPGSWYDGTTPLGADWSASTSWPAMRGDADALTPRARDFRLGVRAVDAQLALSAGDSAAFALCARELATLAAALPAGSVLAAQLDALPLADTTTRLRIIAAVRTQVEMKTWFDLGVWMEDERAMIRLGYRSSDDDRAARRRRLTSLIASLSAEVPPSAATGRIVERLLRIAAYADPQSADLRLLAAALDSTMSEAAR